MSTKRHEYKYTITDLGLEAVFNAVRFHPKGFKKAYPDRQVNNYYMDNDALSFFYQNIDGISVRRKFRYRWYDKLQEQSKVVLETKFKENELGWKSHHITQSSFLKSRQKLIKHFNGLRLVEDYFVPQLYNSYLRSYFISHDEKFRLTIDRQQQFGIPYYADQAYKIVQRIPDIVLELKFDQDHSQELNDVTSFIPYLRTKNSKYSNGIQALYQEF